MIIRKVKKEDFDQVFEIEQSCFIDPYPKKQLEYEFNETLARRYFDDYLNARDSFDKFTFSNKGYNLFLLISRVNPYEQYF